MKKGSTVKLFEYIIEILKSARAAKKNYPRGS